MRRKSFLRDKHYSFSLLSKLFCVFCSWRSAKSKLPGVAAAVTAASPVAHGKQREKSINSQVNGDGVRDEEEEVLPMTLRSLAEDDNGRNASSSLPLLSPSSPSLCLYITGHNWDHYLLFAMTEINSGRYEALAPILPVAFRILYANPTGTYVAGEALQVYGENADECSAFVGPAWSSQMGAIGELASLGRKPVVSGGATIPLFSAANFDYVSRVVPSDEGLLDAFVQLIVLYQIPLINVVLFNDEYGRSIAEGLVTRSEGRFEVQLLRTFSAESTDEGLRDILADLEGSPTHATFLSMTVLPVERFLNAAGAAGMHDSHLWLCPQATQVVDKLDPPVTGAWGLAYGEELQADDPLGQRYLAKDPAPHIAGQQVGLPDDYTTLTLWGAYAYDAVLTVAHALVAVSNDTAYSGERLQRAIRNVTVTQGSNTGVIAMDKNGDRIGARIPLFYATPDGTFEKFAVLEGDEVTILQDPLWPKDCKNCPGDLIRLETEGSDANIILFFAITLPIVAVVVVVLLWLLWRTNQDVRDVRHAPKDGDCCLLFTDIQASSTLWGMVPREMSDAIDKHHSVIRTCLKTHAAYEVKTIGDSFMISVADPTAALRLAMDLQIKLFEADWDPAIDKAYETIVDDIAKDSRMWRGLRVRASVHYGSPDIVLDQVTKGYDYYGNVVNEAARIEGLAHGGQTLISDEVKNQLNTEPNGVYVEDMGEHDLRGCPGRLRLWQVTPQKFGSRQFPPLRTGCPEKNEDDEDDGEWVDHEFVNVAESSEFSVASSVAINNAEHGRWIRTLFSIFKISKREELMTKFCASWRVANEEMLIKRISKIDRAQRRKQNAANGLDASSFRQGIKERPDLFRNVSVPSIGRLPSNRPSRQLSLVAEGVENGESFSDKHSL